MLHKSYKHCNLLQAAIVFVLLFGLVVFFSLHFTTNKFREIYGTAHDLIFLITKTVHFFSLSTCSPFIKCRGSQKCCSSEFDEQWPSTKKKGGKLSGADSMHEMLYRTKTIETTMSCVRFECFHYVHRHWNQRLKNSKKIYTTWFWWCVKLFGHFETCHEHWFIHSEWPSYYYILCTRS